MTEKRKDPMILFRTALVGKNSKGGDRYQLYLNPDETVKLFTALADANGERGAKLDLHITDKVYEGRTFKSAIAFVKATQEPVTGTGKRTFVPKAVATGTNGETA